jgi:hypothetical protein
MDGSSPLSGMQHIAKIMPSVLREVAANEAGRGPRYRVEGRMIVSVHTGRRQNPVLAREALRFQIEGVLATNHEELVESDLAMINDLIRAIREAERNDPLPPAQAMAVAA